MEESLKSVRLSFRLLCVFVLITAAFLVSDESIDDLSSVFPKWRFLSEIATDSSSFERWMLETNPEIGKQIAGVSRWIDSQARERNLYVIEGFSEHARSRIPVAPISFYSNVSLASVHEFVKNNLEAEGAIVSIDLENFRSMLIDIFDSDLEECGTLIETALKYSGGALDHSVTITGMLDIWIAPKLFDPIENCKKQDNSPARVKIEISGILIPQKDYTLSKWISKKYSIVEYENFITKSDIELFGFLPLFEDYETGYSQFQKIIEANSEIPTSISFAGMQIRSKFISLFFPAICSFFYLLISLQLYFIRDNERLLGPECWEEVALFPSPIVRLDRLSLIVVFFICGIIPVIVIYHLLSTVLSFGILVVTFGGGVVFGLAALYTLSLLIFLYVRYAHSRYK